MMRVLPENPLAFHARIQFTKGMSVLDYTPVLIQIILALSLAGIILFASHLFGQKANSNAIKDSAYECGMISDNQAHPQFSIKFYITAMLFILFDIEVVFLIPWVLTYREFVVNSISIVLPILFFLSVLTIGLVYEIKKGALRWER